MGGVAGRVAGVGAEVKNVGYLKETAILDTLEGEEGEDGSAEAGRGAGRNERHHRRRWEAGGGSGMRTDWRA